MLLKGSCTSVHINLKPFRLYPILQINTRFLKASYFGCNFHVSTWCWILVNFWEVLGIDGCLFNMARLILYGWLWWSAKDSLFRKLKEVAQGFITIKFRWCGLLWQGVPRYLELGIFFMEYLWWHKPLIVERGLETIWGNSGHPQAVLEWFPGIIRWKS